LVIQATALNVVVITHPYSESGEAARAQFDAVKKAEHEKRVRLAQYFTPTDRFVPFGMETYGAWGPSATALVRHVAVGLYGEVDKASISKFTRNLAVRTSVALQKEVAASLIRLRQEVRTAQARQLLGLALGISA
jgi:hypothetical protein